MNSTMFSKDLESHLDDILEILENLDLTKGTILTGNNGTGKSLIRNNLSGFIDDKIDGEIKAVSMDLRTRSGFGISSEMPTLSTSQNTFNLIQGVLSQIKKSEKQNYLILDEFEIGCSEETILAISLFLEKELKDLNVGWMIITHSRIAVQNISSNYFINLQGLTKEEWLNREIVPIDLEELMRNDFRKTIKGVK